MCTDTAVDNRQVPVTTPRVLPHPPAVTPSSSLTVWFQSWHALTCDVLCVVHAVLVSSDRLHSYTSVYSECVYYLLCSCAYHNISRRLSPCLLLCRVFLRSTARSATRPLRSSFSLRHCPSSLPMFLIYFLRTKFSQFCCKTHDASVARIRINIRFNFEISTHIKGKKTLIHQRLYSIFLPNLVMRYPWLEIYWLL